MKFIKYSIVFILFTAIIFLFSFDEVPFIERLKAKLTSYHQTYPEEKIYLQLDKPFYKPGEDIWFNAFLLNSNTHKPSLLSDVIYVELLDPKGNVASRMELYQKEGTSHGDFKLSESAAGGLYKLKAYTQWMSNFGEEAFFKRDIQVQRVLTPRLLVKMDFEKEAYGPNDKVIAKLTVRNLKNEKVGNARIVFSASVAGARIFNAEVYTDIQGNATLSFHLPPDLKSTDGLLHAIVEDAGVQESISRAIPIVLNKITLNFFPEGGDLVENTECKIAFKAVNEFGKGADVTGIILDDKKNTITSFESFHMGMGAASFTPLPGRSYFAQVTQPEGNADLISLPLSKPSGYTLAVTDQGSDEIIFKIHSSLSTNCYLVGQVHGEIYEARKVNLEIGENNVNVNTKTFPAGIAVFTLFDADGLEQCERLVFVNAQRQLSVQLTMNKKSYLPREKVEVKIETKDEGGYPVPAKLSLAVVDDQLISFADDKQDNILSWFLLSSELKGIVQEPSFYFDKDEPKAPQALDYLLLTQGWRRFTWKELDRGKTITYAPEKEGILSGWVVNNKGTAKQAEVTLLELNNKRRIAKVQTTKEGQFVFKNTDPTTSILLLTRRPDQIMVEKSSTGTRLVQSNVNSDEDVKILREENFPVKTNNIITPQTTETRGSSQMDMTLTEDVQQLSEVVVIGYGAAEKRDFTGSVVSLRPHSLENIITAPTLENNLQGRVAGVMIQPQTGNPGAHAVIRIRGLSSLAAGRGEPLYVIDGQPVGNSLNSNFSTGSIIGPDDVESIEVINSPEATALFGSQAANGVIMITTKSRIGRAYASARKKTSHYSSAMIYPRVFSVTREFYSPVYTKKREEGERNDFRTTVYWNHSVVTDVKGEATVSFYTNDATTAFRLTAEGISGNGLTGRREETYYTQLPFALDVKLPEFLSYEDTLLLPVRIRNTTSKSIAGQLDLTIPKELQAAQQTMNVEVPPASTITKYIAISPKGIEGTYPILISLKGEGYTDEVRQMIKVYPIGFPVRISFSAKELDKTMRFTIHDAEQGSLKAEFNAFPDVISDLFTGAESILREPYGCFEQVSSSTFPNILALQFMTQAGTILPDVEKRALNYIDAGYKKLAAYEIKDGGFEWFGHPPAHEALSAFGLVEFHEMKKVYKKVDENLINRTRAWLLSRRDNKGGFKQNSGKYGFSSASAEVNNAYIVYALAETGSTASDIEKEYQHALEEALQSKDMYRMALTAITAFDLGKKEDYEQMITHFKNQMNSSGLDHLKKDHSIVWSQGLSLENETVAFWALALAKETYANRQLIDQCIQFLLSHRSYGGFGSTQATTVSLQALTVYAHLMRATKEAGEISLSVNKLAPKTIKYEKDCKEKLVMSNFNEDFGSDGEQQLKVIFKANEPIPYTVDLQWSSKTPPANELSKVSIDAFLDKTSTRVNETVRLNIKISNKTVNGLPMTIAVVGIPAGLSVQPWQLKELQEKGVFDFYEIINDRIAFYYREMAPSGTQLIKLDLKAELPGTYVGAANSTYLYYNNEWKDWKRGVKILVEK